MDKLVALFWTTLAATVVLDVTLLTALLAPLADEPGLEEQYGDGYRRYRERCPRFVGWSSLQVFGCVAT